MVSIPRPDGRQLRWQQHNESRRQQVIDAAIVVLEAKWPASEIAVQQIAEQAGINRSVLYRYFDDRADLDLAVQREICRQLSAAVVPAITLHGTIREIVQRIVGAYVGWAAAHPALTRFVEQEIPGASERPVEATIELFAAQIEHIIVGVVAGLGGELSESDRAALEPWVYALIGGGISAVRRWSSRPTFAPPPDQFAQLVSDTIWFQIAGLAGEREIPLPDGPIDAFVESLATDA